jgi:hypothetical protein
MPNLIDMVGRLIAVAFLCALFVASHRFETNVPVYSECDGQNPPECLHNRSGVDADKSNGAPNTYLKAVSHVIPLVAITKGVFKFQPMSSFRNNGYAYRRAVRGRAHNQIEFRDGKREVSVIPYLETHLNASGLPIHKLHVPVSNQHMLIGLNFGLPFYGSGLPLYRSQCSKGKADTSTANDDQQSCQDVVNKGQLIASTPRFVFFCAWVCASSLIIRGIGGSVWAGGYIDRSARRQWGGGLLVIFGYLGFCTSLLSMVFDCLPWNWRRCLRDGEEEGQEYKPHSGIIVAKAKAANQSLSEWIRSTIHAVL